MNAPIADSAVTRRHPPLDSDAFDALLAQLTAEFATSAAHYDRTAEFPHANLARLHAFDLLSLTVSRDNPFERHYRDVLCARIHTPQNDSVLLGAGRAGFASLLPV